MMSMLVTIRLILPERELIRIMQRLWRYWKNC